MHYNFTAEGISLRRFTLAAVLVLILVVVLVLIIVLILIVILILVLVIHSEFLRLYLLG